MTKSRSKNVFISGLLAVFLCAAVPAVADETPSRAEAIEGFDLGLAEALSELEDNPSAVEFLAEETRAAPVVVASLSSEAVAEMWRSAEQVSAQSSSASGASSGKKWWKKKKWWIPIVAAVVVGVASADGDGDNNLDDEED